MAVLNEEQTMLRDMAREWTTNESPVTEWRKVRASGDPKAFDPAAWGTMAEMGWAGIIIPEEHGGSDFGWLSAGLVVEELGKTLTASPIVANTLAAAAITMGGSDEQKSKWLPKLAAGEAIGTLAVDEGRGSDPLTVSGGKLTGTNQFVHEAHGADLFVVFADDGVYLVEKGDGLTLSDRKLADMRSHAQVTFDNAAADKLASGPDDLAEQVLDRARILTAAEMLGMAQHLFDSTLDYLKQRVQFNQVLATFQALQHRMADLFSDLAMMRSAVEAGLQALDSGFDVPRAACIAKAQANDVLNTMSREAIQLHGGIGMTDEYDVGFYIKRARVLEASWGKSATLRDRFATLGNY
ncbi:Short/branched chain specific acyl-CoA dehydrogenase, mitochondrial [Alteripontixanthobacter maritimus]|uniref:Short/branched chain specific acyl-CoA dehydrogenase, mitochondrial n=1 Tax=Alteripontixanthobacter maritimus TaxID=2161824 RepID=A0A369Q7N0_9SPHN|nr:acyl-CoA dehydrogenase family protein [Alteripontixanthobacter maritimus]RDC59176.1 Short/branched chain specific acyl-CoA dehydrogenase, mitochondrial [Alteripontixanthobacter maritimus]